MMTGTNNMWVNVGDSQFHLPTGPATVAEGIVTGLVVPDLDELAVRLEFVRKELAGTNFSFGRTEAGIEVTCPWGNRFVCHAPDETRFGPYRSWISYVRFEVAQGTAEPIALWFKTSGFERGFYYYLTGVIAVSLLVYVSMRDTQRHSAMARQS
jgi:hypothetical protein